MDDLDKFVHLSARFKNQIRDLRNRRFRDRGNAIRPVVLSGAPSEILLDTINKTAPGETAVLKVNGPLEIQTQTINNVDTVPDRLWFKFPAPIDCLEMSRTLQGSAIGGKSSLRSRVIRGEITSGSMIYPPQTQTGNNLLGGYFVMKDWDIDTLVQSNAPGTTCWLHAGGGNGFFNDGGNQGFSTAGAGSEFVPPTVDSVVVPAEFKDYHQVMFLSAFQNLYEFKGINSSTVNSIELSSTIEPDIFAGASVMINGDDAEVYNIISNDATTLYTETMPSPPTGFVHIYPILYGFFLYMYAFVAFGSSEMDGFQNFKIQDYLVV